MSTYGYERDTTPNLTALTKEGILFENMYSNATWTLPSHASIFTGLYPSVHSIVKSYDTYLDPSIPLLPDVLHKAGYETYFFAPMQEPNIARQHVYNRGIDYWDEKYWSYTGKEDQYLTLALSQLEKNNNAGKKTFMFFHTYMCHGPYFTGTQPLLYTENLIPSLPHSRQEIYDKPFTEGFYHYLLDRLPVGIQSNDFHIAPEQMKQFSHRLQTASNFQEATKIFQEASDNNFWGESLSDYEDTFWYWNQANLKNTQDVSFLQAIYDQGIHTMDDRIFATFRTARASSSWKDNTIVIITSDHGEEFMEHGQLGHSTVYDFNTKVLLLMLIPGMRQQSINEAVQSVDIMPTTLQLIALDNAFHFNGKSLVPLLEGHSLGDRIIKTEAEATYQPNIMAIRLGDWKLLIQKTPDGTIFPFEMYNTKKDPSESVNVLNQSVETAKLMIHMYSTEKK